MVLGQPELVSEPAEYVRDRGLAASEELLDVPAVSLVFGNAEDRPERISGTELVPIRLQFLQVHEAILARTFGSAAGHDHPVVCSGGAKSGDLVAPPPMDLRTAGGDLKSVV